MDPEDRSRLLFGRYEALAVYVAIAGMTKDEFTSQEVSALSGVTGSALSDELSKLVRLDVVERVGRRGRFRRKPSALWRMAEELAAEWR